MQGETEPGIQKVLPRETYLPTYLPTYTSTFLYVPRPQVSMSLWQPWMGIYSLESCSLLFRAKDGSRAIFGARPVVRIPVPYRNAASTSRCHMRAVSCAPEALTHPGRFRTTKPPFFHEKIAAGPRHWPRQYGSTGSPLRQDPTRLLQSTKMALELEE